MAKKSRPVPAQPVPQDDDSWLDTIVEENQSTRTSRNAAVATAAGDCKAQTQGSSSGSDKLKRKASSRAWSSATATAVDVKSINYSNPNLSNRAAKFMTENTRSSIWSLNNNSTGMSQTMMPSHVLSSHSSRRPSFLAAQEPDQYSQYIQADLDLDSKADLLSSRDVVKSDELRMMLGVESDPEYQVDPLSKYSVHRQEGGASTRVSSPCSVVQSATQRSGKMNFTADTHIVTQVASPRIQHQQAPPLRPPTPKFPATAESAAWMDLGSGLDNATKKPEHQANNHSNPSGGEASGDKAAPLDNSLAPPTPPMQFNMASAPFKGVNPVVSSDPPERNPEWLLPTFHANIGGRRHYGFIVTEEQYMAELEKAKRLQLPLPLRMEEFSRRELIPMPFPLIYVSTDTSPPRIECSWWPSAAPSESAASSVTNLRVAHPKEEAPTSNEPQVSAEPDSNRPTDRLHQSLSSQSVRNPHINPDAEEFVPSACILQGANLHTSYMAPSSAASSTTASVSNSQRPNAAPMAPPIVIMNVPQQKQQPSKQTNGDTKRAQNKHIDRDQPRIMQQPPAPCHVSYAAAAAKRNDSHRASITSNSPQLMSPGGLDHHIMSSTKDEYTPLGSLPLCLPDRLNYKAFKAGRFDMDKTRLLARMHCLDSLIVRGGLSGPGDLFIIPLAPVDVHQIGFKNRSDKNECYLNTVIQALSALPCLVRYILACGRCPDPAFYPVHAGLFRVFSFMCGIQTGPISPESVEQIIDFALAGPDHVPRASGSLKRSRPTVTAVATDFMKEAWSSWITSRSSPDAQEDAEEFLQFVFSSLDSEVGWTPRKPSEEFFVKTKSKKAAPLCSHAIGSTSAMDLLFGFVKRSYSTPKKLTSVKERSWILSPESPVFEDYQAKMGRGKDDKWPLGALLAAELQDASSETSLKWEYRSRFERLPPLLYVMIRRSIWDKKSAHVAKRYNVLPLPDRVRITDHYLVEGKLDSDIWGSSRFSDTNKIASSVNEEVVLTLDNLKKGNSDIQASKDSRNAVYSLLSGLIHTGGYAGSGHYVALSKRGDDYYIVDDESIEKAEGKKEKEEGYVLFMQNLSIKSVVLDFEQ
eukprot:GHVH01009372.1.p1 GENE.GHVH01009372.1~~GHVH01009372.1.p1  ORF type:complete len:1091 (-),score=181.19 GHVH01009372.1:1276-4548(-)